MPEIEIVKPVSRKTVYDAGYLGSLARYQEFEEYFYFYGFTDPIRTNDLMRWLEHRTVEKNWLVEVGFFREKRPAFETKYLPIETEEEFRELKELIVTKPWTDIRRRILARLNDLYSPTRSECGEGG